MTERATTAAVTERTPATAAERSALAALGAPVRAFLQDPLAVVYLFVVAAFLIPGRMIVAPLGALGSPATILAVGAAALYVVGRLVGGHLATGLQPMRTATLVLGFVLLVSYAVGRTRSLTLAESNGSDRTLIHVAGLVGLALLTMDAVRTREHLDRLLRLVVWCASAFALMGIVQWMVGLSPESYVQVPGLTLQAVDINVQRSLFTRVQSTALHPIEFGVVLAASLPLALHYALMGRADGRPLTRWRWVPVVLVLTAIPLSVSRASVLGVVVGGLTAWVAWSWRVRFNAIVAGILMGVAMRAAFPGVLGTLLSSFLWAGEDPSIEGRTNDYPRAMAYILERPWLGRGLGTFTPEQYFFLDNEYLNLLLTAGLVGAATLVAFFLVAMGLGRGVYHHAASPVSRSLGQALTACTAVTAVTWFTYDGFAFRLNAGLAFVLVGATAALWRLEVGRFRWGRDLNRTRPVQFVEAPDVRTWGEVPAPRDDG